jgi:hypothetical protein
MWSPMRSVGIIEPDGILKASMTLERTMSTSKMARMSEAKFSKNDLRREGAAGLSI